MVAHLIRRPWAALQSPVCRAAMETLTRAQALVVPELPDPVLCFVGVPDSSFLRAEL